MWTYKNKVLGWTAEETVRFGDKLELTVSTYKRGTNLVTTARVDKINDGYRTHALFQDFTSRLLLLPCKRVTAKAVSEQQSLISIDDVLVAAKLHYGVE
jgi:hypothetical protein